MESLPDIERAENLIRQARLARQRGQKDIARKLLEEAIELAPEAPTILEAKGDECMERFQYKAALELYEKAKNADPSNVALERKFGETVLKIAEAADPLAFASRADESVAGGKVAVILSVIIPGLGQFVTGKQTPGLGMFGGWIVGWFLALLIPNGMSGVMGLFGVKTSGGQVANFNGIVLIPLAIAGFCHLWATLDAGQRASQLQRKRVDRPAPPVDKPFEL